MAKEVAKEKEKKPAKAKGGGGPDFKKVLIAKGEYIAMGGAGLFLAILLVWGASRWAGAKDPTDVSKKLNSGAQTIQSGISSTSVNEEDLAAARLPDWLTKPSGYKPVPVSEFPITGPAFDPIAKPDTKKENPIVSPIGVAQIDLVRGGMPAFDIIYDNENKAKIGVIVTKKGGEFDKNKSQDFTKTVKGRATQGANSRKTLGMQPGGMQPGGMQPGGMQPGGMQPGGMGMGEGGSNPYGGAGTGFDATAQRVTKAITYVPLEELDKAMADGKVPAMTVLPLRMITINAEVPFKKQVEEIKRALRLPTTNDALLWGPIYDGYEIRRKVSRNRIDGSVDVLQDWAEYKFEDKYVELINARKLADQIEDGYLSYFIRYDMALALPLPQLIPELGGYPNIRLDSINNTIKKLKDANTAPQTASDLLTRLDGRPPRKDLYTPQTGSGTGAAAVFGGGEGAGGPMFSDPRTGMGMGMGMGGTGPRPMGSSARPGDKGNAAAAPPVEIEQLLMRFIDVDVKPGYTYEYQVRLRMLNPNFERVKEVANPAFASVKELFSPWIQLRDQITVPAESYLYSIDPAGFRKRVEEEYKDQKDLRDRLQAKDHQAVVEMCQWLEQVRTDGKREPVGAWVVADMPVGRGDYVGRKQYIKLPLWSSESTPPQYVLRESAERVIAAKKDVTQPKGWLVDFTTKSVLVDFDGGKVTTKVGQKSVTEDAATELLIVRPDGKLVVKNSLLDENNEIRKPIVEGWDKWIKEVEKRKAPAEGGMGGDDNPFNRKKD